MNWNELIAPLLSIVMGGVSAYLGVRVALVRLETQMANALDRLERLHRRTSVHGEDLLIHDMEIGTVMEKLQMRREVRQRVRERYSPS